MIHGCLVSREEDAEKQSKGEEDCSDAAVAASASTEASQTTPQVPITTPPPPVTDMSGQSSYGGYNSWYQVGSQTSAVNDPKVTLFFHFMVTSYSFVDLQQPQYGSYGYQNTWNYNQGYYPTS